MLGITESSASALFTFNTAEVESSKITEDEEEPATYQAALKSPQAEKWKEAMQQEWQALIENQTFVGIASHRSPLRRGAPLEASPQQRLRRDPGNGGLAFSHSSVFSISSSFVLHTS